MNFYQYRSYLRQILELKVEDSPAAASAGFTVEDNTMTDRVASAPMRRIMTASSKMVEFIGCVLPTSFFT